VRENQIAVSVHNKSAMTIALEQRHLYPLLQKVYLSINETVQYIGVSKRTIERMISKGKLQVVRFQRRVVLSRITIDELFRSQIDPPDFSCAAPQRAANQSFPAAIEKLAILW
jgi:excisionase family DNA binding protein